MFTERMHWDGQAKRIRLSAERAIWWPINPSTWSERGNRTTGAQVPLWIRNRRRFFWAPKQPASLSQRPTNRFSVREIRTGFRLHGNASALFLWFILCFPGQNNPQSCALTVSVTEQLSSESRPRDVTMTSLSAPFHKCHIGLIICDAQSEHTSFDSSLDALSKVFWDQLDPAERSTAKWRDARKMARSAALDLAPIRGPTPRPIILYPKVEL